jgi:hypothetical protein
MVEPKIEICKQEVQAAQILSKNTRLSEWRSGIKERCSKLTSALVTTEVVGSIPGQTFLM